MPSDIAELVLVNITSLLLLFKEALIAVQDISFLANLDGSDGNALASGTYQSLRNLKFLIKSSEVHHFRWTQSDLNAFQSSILQIIGSLVDIGLKFFKIHF